MDLAKLIKKLFSPECQYLVHINDKPLCIGEKLIRTGEKIDCKYLKEKKNFHYYERDHERKDLICPKYYKK